jgi:hypothetical protein
MNKMSENLKRTDERKNVVKDEAGDMLVDHHSIPSKWKNHFCQLQNVSYVAQQM